MPGATNYELNLTADEQNWPAAIATGGGTTSQITSYLTSVRYWRTRALVGGVWQAWSPVQTINVNHAPVVTLLGENPLQLMVGDPYVEAGATAADTEDGDVTGSLVINTSQLDLDTPGAYPVSYTAYDTLGLSTEVLRTVEVIAPVADMQQINSETDAVIPAGFEIGGTAQENTVKFQGMVTDPEGDQVRLVVGIQLLTPEPGEMTWLQSTLIDSGEVASVTSTPLLPGNTAGSPRRGMRQTMKASRWSQMAAGRRR